MERIIEQTEDGSTTLFVPELNEHYHSVKGARTESQHIFIDMGLKASAATLPHILEIGFGTGLNALLTLETAGLEQRPVHYTGIELYPLSWEEVNVLHYSDNPLFKELHTAPWHKDVNITPYFTLHKIQGDVNKVMSDKQSAMSDRLPVHHSSLTTNHYFDLVYFDAFAPEKQPEMWSEELFRHIYAAMNNNGILTTYCAKGVILCLITGLAGCFLPVIPGPPVAYAGLLLLHFTDKVQYSATQLLLWLLIVVIVQVLDYFVPMLGSKYSGGTHWGTRGCLAGTLIGLFFMPWGIILGPFLGAFIGELFGGRETRQALKSGLGSLFGFLFGTVLKCVLCGYFAWEFASALL